MDDMLVAAEALQGLRSAALAQKQFTQQRQHPSDGHDPDPDPNDVSPPTPSSHPAIRDTPPSMMTVDPGSIADVANSTADLDSMDIDHLQSCDQDQSHQAPHSQSQMESYSELPALPQPQPQLPPQPQFLTRVSSLPIVETGIRSISSLYESTKSSSKVVQYSASVLENNLRPLSKYLQHNPVVLEVDDFACRQLDRFTSTPADPTVPLAQTPQTGPLPRLPELDESLPPTPHPSRYDSPYVISEPSRSHLALVGQASVPGPASRPASMEPEPPRYRSRWQQVTAGAVAAAGAGAAVLSEESMKSLRYCLEWLQYAANQLNHHMQIIRSWLSSLMSDRAVTLFHNNTQSLTFPSLAAIKRDIADTLRRVVDVVGRYAGSFLRGEARSRVRMFILSLPSRWADLQAATDGRGSDSVEAERVLAFASEADDILTSIRGLFEQSLSTAEQWVGTLGRVPFVSTLVPQHAQHALASPTPTLPVQHLPGRIGPGEAIPNSPTLGLASMSLTSPAPVANSNDKSHSLLPGAFDSHGINHSAHGRKRRTAEDDGFASDTVVPRRDGVHFGVNGSCASGMCSVAAPCAEHGDVPARDSSNSLGDGASPSVLLKRRKKGKQQ